MELEKIIFLGTSVWVHILLDQFQNSIKTKHQNQCSFPSHIDSSIKDMYLHLNVRRKKIYNYLYKIHFTYFIFHFIHFTISNKYNTNVFVLTNWYIDTVGLVEGLLTLPSSTNESFKSEIDFNLSTSESLGAMFNILLKQIDKQISYKVTSDIAISHNLLVELCFVIWVK